MSSYVPAALRRLVALRANHLCEYCLIHEEDTFMGCEIEHIISEKHGGKSVSSNLAWACFFCNRLKGSDIATFVPSSKEIVRLFNPRSDKWSRHFRLRGLRIVGITNVGKATIELLDLNSTERLLERKTLAGINHFPRPQAKFKISHG